MAERVVRFPTSEMTPAGPEPLSARDGYRFHDGCLFHGTRRLGHLVRAHVEKGNTTMVVTIDPDKAAWRDVRMPLSLWRADVAEQPWMTIVVRASTRARAIEIATAEAREYSTREELPTVTVELLDPRGPEGVVIVDAS